ncbi:hypothetical protein PAGA_b0603 [Pseudoalteromonas agarivorans DSM 14585]|uniref:Uncharacterized protein n=1 Tax=Pseudoalteromonas agarivorans DSM 14585 TaxID=1312369 RepID=A0ACA8E2J8_9GAMM|nr:hypothetical protein PAGA_b0603 [Pseudoalteromonas agarivorans DSM 14585]
MCKQTTVYKTANNTLSFSPLNKVYKLSGFKSVKVRMSNAL